MRFKFILMIFLLVQSLFAQEAKELLSEQEMLEDLATLEENLFLTHIDIDRYHSIEEVRSEFEKVRKSIQGKRLHPVDFYRELVPILPVIANGHTEISPPDSFYDSLRSRTVRFPYDLYLDDGEVYVLRDNSRDAFLGEGTRISSINGEDALSCIEDLASNSTRDGYNTNLPMLGATRAFKSYYAFFRGCPEEFSINFFDDNGLEQTYVLPGESLKDLAAFREERYDNMPIRWDAEGYKACDLEVKEGVAIMTINTFSSGEIKKLDGRSYKRFFKQAFDRVQEEGVENLIIDLRANGGGDPGPTIELFSYVHEEPFLFYRSVTTQVNKIPNRKLYKTNQFMFNLIAPLRVRKEKEGLYRANGVQGLKPSKPQKEVFKGNIYVLIGPASYSATGEMAACFKQHNRVTFVGEETGGNPNVNVSGFMPTLILPHSQVQATLPIVRFEMAVDFDSAGRGVLPDHEVKASIEDMIAGRDAVMEYTLDLIEGKASK